MINVDWKITLTKVTSKKLEYLKISLKTFYRLSRRLRRIQNSRTYHNHSVNRLIPQRVTRICPICRYLSNDNDNKIVLNSSLSLLRALRA